MPDAATSYATPSRDASSRSSHRNSRASSQLPRELRQAIRDAVREAADAESTRVHESHFFPPPRNAQQRAQRARPQSAPPARTVQVAQLSSAERMQAPQEARPAPIIPHSQWRERVNTRLPQSSYQQTFQGLFGRPAALCPAESGAPFMPQSFDTKCGALRSMYRDSIVDPLWKKRKRSAQGIRESYRPPIEAYNPITHLPFVRELGGLEA